MRETIPVEPDAVTTVGGVTATVLALMSIEADDSRALVKWERRIGRGPLTVYRRHADGEWAEVGQLTADGNGMILYEDRDVVPGHRYGYRLGVLEGGVERFFGEAWIDIPRPVLALYGAQPNPATRDLNVGFSLPGNAPATLGLYDVAGRSVTSLPVGQMGPGRHVVSLGEGKRISAGIYWIRLISNGTKLTAMAVVIP